MTALVGLPARLRTSRQDQRRQLFRRVFVAGDVDVQHLAARLDLALDDLVRDQRQFLFQVGQRAAHQPLDAEDGVFGIGEAALRGPPCRPARVPSSWKLMTLGHEGDAGVVADDHGLAILDVRREAERGAEIDADDGRSSHGVRG